MCLLGNSTDNNLINSYLEEIMLVCSWNDTLSADVLLMSHVRTNNPLDLEYLEKTLYPELYKNPELLKFVFKQIGAYNRGTNKNILKVLLSHDQDTIDQELKNEVK